MFDNIAFGYYVRYNVFSVENSIFYCCKYCFVTSTRECAQMRVQTAFQKKKTKNYTTISA